MGSGGRGKGGGGGGGRGRGGYGPQEAKKGPLSKQKRGLERLLKKGGLPDEVRREKEAELSALAGEAVQKRRVEREKHFSKKYHGVKFVERQKVTRKLAQLEKQLEDDPEPEVKAALEAQTLESERDLLYIAHYPRSKKYLSLFPAAGGDDAFVSKRRAQIRAIIARRVEAGLPMGRSALATGGVDEYGDDLADAPGFGDGETLDEDDFFAAGGSDAEEADGPGWAEPAAAAPESWSEPPNRKQLRKQRRQAQPGNGGATAEMSEGAGAASEEQAQASSKPAAEKRKPSEEQVQARSKRTAEKEQRKRLKKERREQEATFF